MTKLTATYFFLFLLCSATAQKQANTWYFGNKVGLDFNQTPPTPLYNSVQKSEEGNTVISDRNGKLLFYTNGLGLLNRKHQPMKNGNGLMGDLSSTDNDIIIPAPGNDSIYYLFTIGAAFQPTKGFRYNIINIRGDSGYGEVISKNIILENAGFEKLSAVKHCNKTDVWVTIHKWDTDEYQTYLVTASGVNPTPMISHTGLFITGIQDNTIGTLKFSIDGKKLVAVHSYQNNMIELMQFDNTTGQITSPIVFQPEVPSPLLTVTGVYGAEFSPDGNLLYVSDNYSADDPGLLYQFDISSNNAATILASRQVISNSSPWFLGNLQIGPDLKIYMAMLGDSSLSVIENPNVYGPGCNFMYNKIFLGLNGSDAVRFGLPNFIQSYFDIASNPYDFTRSGNCTDLDVAFSINRLTGIDSVKWNFGDGQQSVLLAPVNHYSAPGYYTVKLVIYKVDCSGLNDTVSRKIWVAGSSGFLGIDTGSCSLATLQIGVDDIEAANYLWNTGAVTNKINSNVAGLYWLRIEQNGCSITDSINISLKPNPVINIGRDTTVCINKSIVLNAASISADAYLWNTGETSSGIRVNMPGLYYVTVTKNSCVASDTLIVTWGDCEAFFPTAFTPDNNGLNDYFGAASGFTAGDFFMEVFDRWGNMVFISGNINKKWDGNYKGKPMPNGVYSWIMHYTNTRGIKRYMQGTVLLIR